MPARVLHVVEQLVVRVPAKDHIAKAHALFQRGEEFLATQVLATQDPVAVEHADFDMFNTAILDRGGQRCQFIRIFLRHEARIHQFDF